MKYFLTFLLLCFSLVGQDSFDPFQQIKQNVNNFEQNGLSEKSKLVTAKSFTSHTSLSKDDKEFIVYVELEIAKDWYVYWKNSGGISLPTEIELKSAQKNLTVSNIRYSTPKYYFAEPEYPSFILEGKVFAAVTIQSSETLTESVFGDLKVLWQACKKDGQCIPGESTVSFKIPVGVSEKNDITAKITVDFPKKTNDWSATVRYEASKDEDGEEVFIATVTLKTKKDSVVKAEDLKVFANFSGANTQTTKQKVTQVGEGQFQTVYTNLESDGEVAFDAVVKVKNEAFLMTVKKEEEAIEANGKQINEVKIEKKQESLPYILLLAFIGGFILNLMPCVFPVVSLKVMGFVKQSQEGKGSAFAHALVFTAGVIVSFWIIAIITIAIKASGTEVLWGAQQQNPYFVLAMCLIFLVLALSMFGVFEIGVSLTTAGSGAKKSGLSGSFFSGVLATVAATPCMAPFMGSAIAYAFSQPAGVTILVFTVMSIGMSFPYLVFAQFPSLLKVIPKPGPWMETFKQGLGFLLIAAVIYFTKTLQEQLSSDALTAMFFVYLLFAIASWVYGKYTPIYLEKATRVKGMIATLIIVIGAVVYAKGEIAHDINLQNLKGEELAEYQRKSGEIAWQKWSPEAVAKARAEGKPVFIDFTATWCLNCQVNKKVAIRPNAKLFYEKGVVMFKADNTKNVPEITKAVHSYGSAGVPLNLLFFPDEEEPYKFPEVYSKGILTEQLEKIK